ncbi:hypothetical protein C4565_10325 [Candidatus Parcubacteria bacterium]|jgi:thymidylate kinase|nr:MAG: hypothetical protein C4565_10325 [Candidatus Parcubacteria bacterium]
MKKAIYISIEGPNGSGKSTLAKKIFQYIKDSGMPAVLNTQPTKKSQSEVGDFESKGNPIGVVIRELIERRMPTDEMIRNYLVKLKELKKICLLNVIGSDKEEDTIISSQFITTLYNAHSLIIEGKSLDEKTMQALYCADGLFDFKETVIPAIKAGVSDVKDRERFTSFAHGDANGFSFEENLKIHQIVLGDFYIKPDIMFYLDVPVPVCVERLSKSGKVLDIYEEAETIGRIIQSYKKAIEFFKMYPEVGYKNIHCINGEQNEDLVFKDALLQLQNLLSIR